MDRQFLSWILIVNQGTEVRARIDPGGDVVERRYNEERDQAAKLVWLM